MNGPVIDLRGKYRRLIDSALPTTTELKQEGSGFGLISVFLTQITAEFTPLIKCPADKLFLRGLDDNILRMASDMYWADKIPSYLTDESVMSEQNKNKLKSDIKEMRKTKIVTISKDIIPHLLKLVRYVLTETFWLNNQVEGSPDQASRAPSAALGSRKRKRIVHRLGKVQDKRKRDDSLSAT